MSRREGASSSASSGSSSVAIAVRPASKTGARLLVWTLARLLEDNQYESGTSMNGVLLDCPVERIQSLNTNFVVVVSIGATLKEELDQRWNMRAENGDFLIEVSNHCAE